MVYMDFACQYFIFKPETWACIMVYVSCSFNQSHINYKSATLHINQK